MNQSEQASDYRNSAWINSAVFDLALFIATPLAIIPVLLLLAESSYTPEHIALAVFAFASLGHHLPGLIRAYGDRELFRRYRYRFLIAPPVLLAISWISFVTFRSHGLEVILLFWATWHILMQTYGFMRIYDAKIGIQNVIDARIDFWACIAVFTSGIVFSDARVFGIAESFSLSGLPILGHNSLIAIRWFVGVGTCTAILVVAVRTVYLWQSSARASGLKTLLLFCTALLFWTAGRLSVNLLIGVAMFEVFHAIQYCAIVWSFNRRRADESGVGFGPLKTMFRRNWWGLPVYGLTICAFGAIGFLGRTGELSSASRVAMALFSASAMLHFYYDGFIWQVRQKKTREGLNIQPGANDQPTPSAIKHVLQWGTLTAILLAFAMLEYYAKPNSAGEAERRLSALAALTPELPELQTRLSQYSMLIGDPQTAYDEAEKAVRLRPRSYAAQIALGNASTALTNWDVAQRAYSIAAALQVNSAEAHFGSGVANVQRRQYASAQRSLMACLQIQKNHAQACFQLGNVYYFTDQPAKAIDLYRRCTILQADFAGAYNNLGAAFFETDDLPNAVQAYQDAIRLKPGNAAAHYNLGLVFYFQGKYDEARRSVVLSQKLGQTPTPELAQALKL